MRAEILCHVEADARERANPAQREPARLAHPRAQWEAWQRKLPAIPPDAEATLLFGDADLPRASH